MSDASALLGTWKMVSWQREVIATGEGVDALGPNPIGYINYGADGRMCALVVKNDRPPPAGAVPTNEEKLRLFDSMLAYAGTYTLHDDRVIHHVDASWNQALTGTDQVRFYNLEDDTLTIHGAPAKDPFTGQEVIHRITFRKV
jgi:Lipocalin-like domain